MPELESVIEDKLIEQLAYGDSQWTYRKDLKTYYDMQKNSLYTSFLKSLTFTASRIPAQTLQSFMQMKAVGFTSSSKNIAYVSHWQTW